MHSPNKITTSKRFIAWVLIFSQLLTSCINSNLPSKQELIDLETTKHNKQRSRLEDSKSNRSITKHTRTLSEISLTPLTDDAQLALTDTEPSVALIVAQAPVTQINPSVINKEQPRLASGQLTITPNTQPIQQKQLLTISKPPASVKKRNELEAYRKQALHERTRQDKALRQASIDFQRVTNPVTLESIIEELALLTFTAQGGHQLNLMFVEDQLAAVVDEQLFIGFSRPTLSLPVYVEPGFDLLRLKNPNKIWQQTHIEILFPERGANGKGYVYIGLIYAHNYLTKTNLN